MNAARFSRKSKVKPSVSGKTVDLKRCDEGVLLPVQAQPRARKNGLAGVHAGCLKVAVTQAPEKGKANRALIKVLAKSLNLKRSQFSLVSGETSTQKMFLVAGLEAHTLRERIQAALT